MYRYFLNSLTPVWAVLLGLLAIVHPTSAQVVGIAPELQDTELRVRQIGTLSEYVTKPDDSFGYELAETGNANNCDWLRFNLTSQTWQGDFVATCRVGSSTLARVDRQRVSKPTRKETLAVTGDSAILFIGGGSWKNEWTTKPPSNLNPPREFKLLCNLAKQAQSPVVFLEHVPFQPILDGRFEDAIIAETFRRYLMGEGEDWPLLLPMVKSAVRCMDMVQDQLPQRFPTTINRFTVTGASKRGWTTWLTAAVDERVDAFAPIVIDMLNMPKQMEHQLETWGKYSEEIGDYTALELQKHLASPRGQMLQSVVDPYSYREVLTQPKLLIFGTNDRYWTLDACNIYWDDLLGPKNRLYIPNNGHGIQDFNRLIGSLAAFHRLRKEGEQLPTVESSYRKLPGDTGQVTAVPSASVEKCTLWLARSASKDFRNSEWISIPMFDRPGQGYLATFDLKEDGHVAFFAEAVFKAQPQSVFLSTNITILSSSK